MRLRTRTLAVVLASAVALVGCYETTPPLAVVDLQGDLEGIGAFPLAASDGFLSANAYPLNPDVQLEPHERIAVEVTTSRGDTETLLLGRGSCAIDTDSWVRCQSFIVGVRDGGSASDLEMVASTVDARLNRIGNSSVFVGHAFGSWALALQRMSTHPAVSYVEYNHIVSVEPLTSSFAPILRQQLHGALPTTTSAVTADDGQLSIAVGDVVTLTFRQPSGGTLVSTSTVQ